MRLAFVCLLILPWTAHAETYGEPMPAGDAVPIAEAMAGETGTEPGKYSGRIGQVCQSKGCWMVLEENGQWARVMTGHKFFLPKDASGRATVYGVLEAVDVEEAQARHLAEDYGGEAEPVMREHRIVATSIVVEG